MTLCTNPEQKQSFLPEQQCLNIELLEHLESTKTIMIQQSMLYDQMVARYDRMLTKCKVKKLDLERIRTENDRFKFTSQCLLLKIKELTSSDDTRKAAVDSQEDVSNGKDDDDVSVEHLEVCSNSFISKMSMYKEKVEKASVEMDEIGDQLEESAKMQSYLQPCVGQLTLLANSERIRRDSENLELQTTMNRLTAELDEVRRDMARLRSVMADKSVKLAELESASSERNAMLRAENARLEANLMTSGTVAALLQSEIFKLGARLAEQADAEHPRQQHQRDSFDGSRDDSSTSLMLYQVSLSRADYDPVVVSCSDLGRGDDQSISCPLSTKDSTVTADDDRRLSCSKSNVVQDVAETTVERSTATQMESRLNDILKKYGNN